MSKVNTVLTTVVLASLVLFLGIAVMSTISESTTEDEVERIETNVGLDGNNYVDVNDGEGVNETVYQSRGNAVELTGADDSYVESDASIDFSTDQNWTVCTWAEVGNTSATMTALDVSGRALIGYNGTSGNWTGWYYDDGSQSSWQVEANATDEDTRLHQACMWHQSDELRFYINATLNDSVSNTSTDNVTPAPVNSSNWNGTLEETRTFDDALDSSQRNATVSDPNDPLPSANRTARLMYDVGSGTTVNIWFADTDATLSNGTWVAGFSGEEMDEKGVISGDYAWDEQGPQIKAVSGGELDGAPVAYVDYDYKDARTQAYESINDGFVSVSDLAGVLFILMVGGVAIVALRRSTRV